MYKIISWAAVILWTALIFNLSSQVAEQSNGLSTGISEDIVKTVEKVAPMAEFDIKSFNNILRKNAHFFAYLVQSKNYSGWIFGDEKSKNWMQTLQNKQRNRFFNPMWQNKCHINALKSATELDNDNLYKSYIIFSERCTLKKINITSPNVKVIKRNALIKTIKVDIQSSSNLMTIEEVEQLYLKLQKYAHADETDKKAHVNNVQMRKL